MQRSGLYISLLALVLSASLLVLFLQKRSKIAYVNIETVYNEFQMKKELEAKFENVQNMRKQILDSLKLQLSLLSKQIQSPKDEALMRRFEMGRQEYLAKEESFMQSNQETMSQYSSQIWKQLNQYIKTYGKEKGYAYVLGMEGKGSVLYGEDALNVTDELKAFVNNEYKGNGGN